MLDDIYGAVPQRMHGVLERIQSNGRHLLGLINDVLDLSKIEAGQVTLSIVNYSLGDVLQGVFVALESLARDKELALQLDVPVPLPMARGDERRMKQVLLNLVGNAIKFTERGSILVAVVTRDDFFDISVSDTGPGIAADEHEKIFEEFHQADNSATKGKSGTGLGLAIARRIVELHGGRIWVESEPGRGATFFVSIPMNTDVWLEPV
jgi:signal transduction histidine kinase